ncbi:MAG TPA: DUF4314 domain-containing protein, partial [Caldimonas sp.]|nr:DUF4314 domain-containing protein [Caldimonas sp.]
GYDYVGNRWRERIEAAFLAGWDTRARQLDVLVAGARVRLVRTTDPHTELRPGARGTIEDVDDAGTIHVAWDSGSSLGMVPGEDVIELLDD